ncbi:MAG: hypothetical protein AB1714_01450 [Acidobacteriota bacterium]
MGLRPLAVVAVALLTALAGSSSIASAETQALPLAFHDGPGNVRSMCLQGQHVPIAAHLWVPSKGWGSIADTGNIWSVENVQMRKSGNVTIWTGQFSAGKNRFDYRQAARETGGTVHLSASVTSRTSAPLEGVYFVVTLPIEVFAGGQCSLSLNGVEQGSAELPVDKPPEPHLLWATGDGAEIRNADSSLVLDVGFGRKSDDFWIQDDREWGGDAYQLLFEFHDGSLPAGESASIAATLRLAGSPDKTPAHLKIYPASSRYLFDGCGGNFHYEVESPQTRHNLDTLRVAWARHVMRLRQWEPRNDNESPDVTNWEYLASRAGEGSDIERDLLLMKELQGRGAPLIATVWNLPKWLHPKPGTTLPAAAWPEALECIGSYLAYAKNQYGVEPEYFSFNEPDCGVYVLFSSRGHRDAIKKVGAHFARIGLKTRLLLGDTCTAQGGAAYALPAASDPEAMKYVGAAAFHSWGGASPSEYGEWADLAELHGLPLLVTEVGSDAGAWMFPGYIQTFGYAIDDLRNYMELLLYARPRGTLLWEYTSDYGLFDQAGSRLVPTARYWFVKHLGNLTPESAIGLETASDIDDVLFVAFRGESTSGTRYVLHVANLGATRSAQISGLPASTQTLDAVRSGPAGGMIRLPPVPVRSGTADVSLPALSLLTLSGGD